MTATKNAYLGLSEYGLIHILVELYDTLTLDIYHPCGKLQTMKLLYITGTDRSGTTMVSRLISGFFNCAVVGEIARFFWQRGVEHNESCSCGQSFKECSFWSSVVEEMAPRQRQAIDNVKMAEYRRIIEHSSRWPARLRSKNPLQDQAGIQEKEARSFYGQCLADLFDKIGTVSERDIIVDTSKNAVYASMLEQHSEATVYVLHILRDSRAVAYSHSREKKSALSSTAFMRKLNATRAARFWTRTNLESLELKRSIGNRYLCVKYEDIVSNHKAFGEIMRRFLSEEYTDLSGSTDRSLVHVFSGNPMRMQKDLSIKPDFEWLTGMKLKDRLIVTCLTLPLLLYFKYPIIPSNQLDLRPDVS